MRKALLLLIGLLFSANIVLADGFKDVKTSYFWGRTYSIGYEDLNPAISDSCYFAISKNDTNYTRLTDNFGWRAPITKDVSLSINSIGSRWISLYANPNGSWLQYEKFSTTFRFADPVTFTVVPDTIYNGGNYYLTFEGNEDQLPQTLRIEYSYNSIDWSFYTYVGRGITRSLNFENTFINKNIKFRVTYIDTSYSLGETPYIPFKNYTPYFELKTQGGQKNLNDKTNIYWEKSYDFSVVHYKLYFNDTLIVNNNYVSDGIELNFAKNGRYNVVCLVESKTHRFEKSISFTVGDPCEEAIKTNKILNDSIVKLNRNISGLNTELLTKDSIIRVRNNKIEYLTRFIRDSSTIKLIYTNDSVTSVKDEKYTIDVRNDLKLTDNFIVLPDNNTDNIKWWLFTLDGKLVKYGNNQYNNKIDITVINNGTYFLYLSTSKEYIVYKFNK